MNILVLSWRGPGHPNAGGAEIATHEHAKAWVKAGHSVTLYTSSFKNCKRNEDIDGIKILRFGNQFLGVHLIAFFWYLFGKHPKFDIVVDQFHGIPFFTPLYVRTTILAYIHEVASEVWTSNEFQKPLNIIPALVGPVVEPLFFKFYKKIDFMTVSDSTKTDLINFGIKKEKISVIYNGFNKVKVKDLKKEKLLTFLGALSKDKGVEDALKIFYEVKRKDEEWKFLIVGRGSVGYIDMLKMKIKELDMVGSISFEGFVTEKKKYEILARSFCFINPSIHEGWGLVNIEANSVGTPVFAYKVKGISDSVNDTKTGILFAKDDTHQMAIEILKLYSDKKRYDYYSKNCIKWSNRFSWDKAVRESLELIESL
jgi:glycosyltransferase involved in cell wall biosynthesis